MPTQIWEVSVFVKPLHTKLHMGSCPHAILVDSHIVFGLPLLVNV